MGAGKAWMADSVPCVPAKRSSASSIGAGLLHQLIKDKAIVIRLEIAILNHTQRPQRVQELLCDCVQVPAFLSQHSRAVRCWPKSWACRGWGEKTIYPLCISGRTLEIMAQFPN